MLLSGATMVRQTVRLLSSSRHDRSRQIKEQTKIEMESFIIPVSSVNSGH